MAGNLMRFDPINEMLRFDPFRNMDDLFREFSVMPSLRGYEPEPRIRLDVEEADEAYMVKADLPGVKKEDIKVAVEGNRVSISAECKREKEEKGNGNVVRSERYYGQQHRSFTLPQDVDETKAQASYSDGVLSLSLPKKAGAGSKQITVQ
ncbi:MAG TPA: Hsp20/alpha crystallin family protein [Noviherbaspirillum sp.]